MVNEQLVAHLYDDPDLHRASCLNCSLLPAFFAAMPAAIHDLGSNCAPRARCPVLEQPVSIEEGTHCRLARNMQKAFVIGLAPLGMHVRFLKEMKELARKWYTVRHRQI